MLKMITVQFNNKYTKVELHTVFLNAVLQPLLTSGQPRAPTLSSYQCFQNAELSTNA